MLGVVYVLKAFGMDISSLQDHAQRKKAEIAAQQQQVTEGQKERRKAATEERTANLVRINQLFQEVQKQGWKVTDKGIISFPEDLHISEPNYVLFGRTEEEPNAFSVFTKLVTNEVWEHIASVSECERERLVALEQNEASKWKTPITVNDIKRYFGWEWYWEQHGGLLSYDAFIRKFKGSFPETIRESPIGMQKWKVISKCLSADVGKLASILSFSFKTEWRSGRTVAIDKTIFQWLGTGDWIVYIPGKPHPRGLMVYVLATFSDKYQRKPYILGCIPHFGPIPLTPLDAAKKLMSSFLDFYLFPPHAILDLWIQTFSIGWSNFSLLQLPLLQMVVLLWPSLPLT